MAPIWRIDTIFVIENGKETDKIAKIYIRGGNTVTVDNPIRPAFSRKNLISYYGYIRDSPSGTSRPVPDEFAADMEDSLVKRFVENVDSTRIANLAKDNITEYFDPPHIDPSHGLNLQENLYLRHFGADDYSYGKCGDPFTDARDGHVYQTACIGDQVWMAENLDFDISGAACYNNISTNCTTYGRLYPWDLLMKSSAATDAIPSKVQGGFARKAGTSPVKANMMR